MWRNEEIDDGSIQIKIETVPGTISLDEVCWKCNSTSPSEITTSIDSNCNICKGNGYLITITGIKILEFIKRWKEEK